MSDLLKQLQEVGDTKDKIITEEYTLVGVDGNAFSVMGYVQKAMKKEGKPKQEISAYFEKAIAGDYNSMLAASQDILDGLNETEPSECAVKEADDDSGKVPVKFDVTDEVADEIADELGISFDVVNKSEFIQGLTVEQEHLDVTKGSKAVTGKIVMAHLKELPNYYTLLKKMESSKEAEPAPKEEPSVEVDLADVEPAEPEEEDYPVEECIKLQDEMSGKGFKVTVDEVAPEGWEPTVKAMKKHKEITNPWALAWYMKGKGYHPKKHKVKEEETPEVTKKRHVEEYNQLYRDYEAAKAKAEALLAKWEDSVAKGSLGEVKIAESVNTPVGDMYDILNNLEGATYVESEGKNSMRVDFYNGGSIWFEEYPQGKSIRGNAGKLNKMVKKIAIENGFTQIELDEATDTTKIKAKHPGVLQVPSDKKFYEMPLQHYIDLAKSKTRAVVMRALMNLERWNKSKHKDISNKAREIINRLKKNSEWKSLAAESKDSEELGSLNEMCDLVNFLDTKLEITEAEQKFIVDFEASLRK